MGRLGKGAKHCLNMELHRQESHAVESTHGSKEIVWHKRYGHLGYSSLKKLGTENIFKGFDFDVTKETVFCEPCAEGKQHRCTFNTNSERRADKVGLLGLVHSDVCGKMGTESLSGGQYFLTFIDDKSRYVWIYILKRKSQVFECFQEWKAMAERFTGEVLKVLRTNKSNRGNL